MECGIVTADHYVPVTEKNKTTSVYARRNNTRETNKLKTCGIEFGPKWCDVIKDTHEKNIVELDMLSGIIAGLKSEFPMPDWEGKEDQVSIEIISCGLQMLHFNTALLGTCQVPYTKDEMLAELKGKKDAGGLDHSNLYFISLQECSEYIGKYSATTDWHGTAMMRLQMIVDQYR